MPRRKKKIFRDLLRDGARSAHGAVRMPGMGAEGIVDFQRVESVMEEESLVLAGDNGGIKVRRNLIRGKVCMRPQNGFAREKMTRHLIEHHGGEWGIDETEDRDLKDRDGANENRDSPKPAEHSVVFEGRSGQCGRTPHSERSFSGSDIYTACFSQKNCEITTEFQTILSVNSVHFQT